MQSTTNIEVERSENAPEDLNIPWKCGLEGFYITDDYFVYFGYKGNKGTTMLDCPSFSSSFQALMIDAIDKTTLDEPST